MFSAVTALNYTILNIILVYRIAIMALSYFHGNRDTVYSVEELVGMMFNNSRQLVEDYAGK